MSSTAFLNQDTPQSGASLANPPKPKAIELNGTPLPALSHPQDEKPLSPDKLSDTDGPADSTTDTTTNDTMTLDKPLTNSTNNHTTKTTSTAQDEAPIAKVIHFFATATPGSLAGVAVGF